MQYGVEERRCLRAVIEYNEGQRFTQNSSSAKMYMLIDAVPPGERHDRRSERWNTVKSFLRPVLLQQLVLHTTPPRICRHDRRHTIDKCTGCTREVHAA